MDAAFPYLDQLDDLMLMSIRPGWSGQELDPDVYPRIAAGCAVVLKPASQTPLSALLLAGCAGTPTVSGVRGTSPSPAVPWTPPAEVVPKVAAADTSARAGAFLAPEDAPTQADAVIYLMRHLHRRDAEFLDERIDDWALDSGEIVGARRVCGTVKRKA